MGTESPAKDGIRTGEWGGALINPPALVERAALGLARHRDAAARGLRARQGRVRGLHAGEAPGDLAREGDGLAGGHVDMQRHVLRGGGDPAFGSVEQLLEVVHPLAVVFEQLERDAHRVAGMKLAQVAHMHLGGEARVPAGLDVVEPATDELEGLVHRAIEQHVIIGHVEMAVIVDPARLDGHHRGDEGGEKQRFEVGAVEHPNTLKRNRARLKCEFALRVCSIV